MLSQDELFCDKVVLKLFPSFRVINADHLRERFDPTRYPSIGRVPNKWFAKFFFDPGPISAGYLAMALSNPLSFNFCPLDKALHFQSSILIASPIFSNACPASSICTI
jgi:hypothetical protein